eukprot:gnl/TRDRNA2_/TRDRNA2_43332_c0_seq1.p1 gnl/TRDRNA2_/TRDRNA2_43332_c0~~gnl/TRDRNA2_/TRDRNA2_43332_c0_seq1.p1  ORF type:complete len:260 (-),score=37.00 gnl/TRDRNA2_/TRDRNA2_43332_c0_seq1:71-850(-)
MANVSPDSDVGSRCCGGAPRLQLVADLVALSGVAGDEAVLNVLVESGEQLDRARANVCRELSLCLAAGRGDVAAVEQSLREGTEANCTPSFGGMTPLMFASSFGHLPVLETLLLQPGLALHVTTNDGQTALSLCRDTNVRRLVAHSIVERSGDAGRYALVQAACLGHPNVAQALLASTVHPDQRDERGRTALQIAALRNHPHVCELLLAHGADPNLRDMNGHTVWNVRNAKVQTALLLYAPAEPSWSPSPMGSDAAMVD